jgi:PAP2 superfamily
VNQSPEDRSIARSVYHERGILTPMNWRYLHYWIGLFLSAALVPVLRRLHLPLNFDWKTLGIAYWLVLAAQSIFVAVLLFLIGLPAQETIKPLLARCLREPLRIPLGLLYFAVLAWALGWLKALILLVDTVALLELRERATSLQFRRKLSAVLLPALYLFAGFLLVLAYNCIIVSVRFGFAYDPVFNAADKWILHGGTVSGLSHWALRTFHLSFFRFLEFVYFGMFPQIGAAMILIAFYDGGNRSMQFVGTILSAYYLALGLFYLWPSQGPYYLCPSHFSRFPASLQAYSIQQFLIRHALALWNHVPTHRISTDYFIAFPCMHIAQPLIALWFLRRWRRMVIVLFTYDSLLIVAILFLEWHYLVDILAGGVVAAAAIAISANSPSRKRIQAGAPSPLRQGTLSIS